MSRQAAAGAETAGDAGPAFPARSTAIVPLRSIAGRALALVIAIMTFLAGLTIGAVTLVDEAVTSWQSDIGREITIEVRPVTGVDLAGEVARAVALVQEFPGVGGARALTDDETQRLLEPWLGADFDLSTLPTPRLVVVTVSDPLALDLAELDTALRDGIRGVSLDDHAAWIDRLRAMAGTMVAVGLAILALVLVALTLSVVFATRAAMAGNSQVVSVLHFVGAEDGFIAREFERHFLLLGIRGGLAGGGLALVAFLAGAWFDSRATGVLEADQLDAFVGGLSVGPLGYLAVVVLIIAVAVLTATTSRLAVRRFLAEVE